MENHSSRPGERKRYLALRIVNRLTKIAIRLALVVLALWVGGKLFQQPSSVKRNVNRYADYVTEMPPHLVGHFPHQIPDNTNARVAFSTGPLQTNMFLQLRMEMDADSIANIRKQVRMNAIAEYNGSSMFDHYNDDQENNFPTTSFYTNEDGSEFPNHFTLYVLTATQRTPDWETTGIAISTKTNTVVYWAEGD